jgi:hypothetical protein
LRSNACFEPTKKESMLPTVESVTHQNQTEKMLTKIKDTSYYRRYQLLPNCGH